MSKNKRKILEKDSSSLSRNNLENEGVREIGYWNNEILI